MEPKVKFVNVSKRYSLFKKQSDKMKDLFLPQRKHHLGFFALQNISFEVFEGETIGVIGINGSGKSTLSNLLAQVIPPSSGRIGINGETSLIAISAGLNTNLTGYENINLKCLMHGLSQAEIKRLTPDIEAFADLGDFINQPVKNYSSGMKSRLGFAISVHTNPDILVVDEALSVGDDTFYQKCLEKMNAFKREGKTIFFISHSLSQIRSFCDKVMWINFGKLEAYGPASTVLDKYKNFIDSFNNYSEADKKKYKQFKLRQQKAMVPIVSCTEEAFLNEETIRTRKKRTNPKTKNSLNGVLFQIFFVTMVVLISGALTLTHSHVGFSKMRQAHAPDLRHQPVKKVMAANVQKIDKKGYVISPAAFFKDQQMTKKSSDLSFATPVTVDEKLGKVYKITVNHSQGFMAAKDVTVTGKGTDTINVTDFAPFLPNQASKSYMFFMAKLGLDYQSIVSTLGGQTGKSTDSEGHKLINYGYEHASYEFNKQNQADKLIFDGVNVPKDALQKLAKKSVVRSKDHHLFLFESKSYTFILNLKTQKLTISKKRSIQ